MKTDTKERITAVISLAILTFVVIAMAVVAYAHPEKWARLIF